MLSGFAARYASLKPRKSHVLLPLAMMAALYALSSVPGTPPIDSNTYLIFYWVSPSLQNLLHVPTYALLGWSWHWALGAWDYSHRGSVMTAFAITLAYGILDEWHQSFVPGRLASLTDLALNAIGAALGIWLALRAAGWQEKQSGQ